MKKMFLVIVIFISSISATTKDFCCGFDYGYRDMAKGKEADGKRDKLTIIVFPVIIPITPNEMTDYEFGVQCGREAAEKRIDQRENSWIKKQRKTNK